jgi:hypothetical protein
MRIHNLEIIERDNDLQIRSLVEYKEKAQYLWYAVDKRCKQYITTEKMDAFVVGLLLMAMRHKEDMEIDGPISEKLYHNLNNGYMHILREVIPSLHIVNILPKSLDGGKSYHCLDGVGTGFSGGVDSFCTIVDYLINNKLANYRITHLLFTNVGSHGEWDEAKARNLFNQRYDMLKPIAQEMGLEFIKVDSNLSEILQFDFLQSHSTRNLSTVLLFQKLFSKYYYSGGARYKDLFIGPSHDIAYSEPATVLLLSTETLECISVGSQYSRVEKTMKVSELESSYRWLNVCWWPVTKATNCSVCPKCCRTLLTLEIIGKLEKYKSVFNLDKYRKVRNSYVRYVLRNKNNPFHREMLEYAKKVEFRFSFANVFLAYVSRFFFPLPLEQGLRKMLPNSAKQRIRFAIKKAGIGRCLFRDFLGRHS